MLNTVLAEKKKMSQTFVGDTRVGVTIVKADSCVVTQVKNETKDGYWAVQLGFGKRRLKNVTKPMQGHLKAATNEGFAPRFLREVRFTEEPQYKVGDIVAMSDILRSGDVVSVTAISKGKGFAGVVKRWGFAGGSKTHGQSNRHRAPGSIGQGTTPGRVWKGKKMAGRMGTDLITIKGLHIINVDKENGEISISGSIPGPKGGFIVIKKTASGSISELEESAPEVVVQEGAEEAKSEAPAA